MPWLETSPVPQREKLIADRLTRLYTMTELYAAMASADQSGSER